MAQFPSRVWYDTVHCRLQSGLLTLGNALIVLVACSCDGGPSRDPNGHSVPEDTTVHHDATADDVSAGTVFDTLDSRSLQKENPWAEIAVQQVNYYRSLVGLDAVVEDPLLSVACQKHAEYMALNQVLTHNEDPTLPGYSEDGAHAGKFSNIAYGYPTIVVAIDKWIEGIYHRLPLFEPGLAKIGVGMAQNYWCLDVINGAVFYLQHEPIAYPADNQRDVPILFDGTESPNPLPESLSAPTGYFISLQFDHDTVLGDDFELLLYHETNVIDSFVRYPNDESDPNRQLQRATVSLTAKKPLRYNTSYEVVAVGTVDGQLYEKVWRFTTKTMPQH